MFLCWEKSRSTSRKDANLFLCWEKSRSTSKIDADLFYFNDKKFIHMQIIDIQERNYNNHIKKKNNHVVNKTIINNSCYGHLKKKKI